MSETIICAKLQFAVRQLSKLPMHNLKVTLHFEVYIMKLQAVIILKNASALWKLYCSLINVHIWGILRHDKKIILCRFQFSPLCLHSVEHSLMHQNHSSGSETASSASSVLFLLWWWTTILRIGSKTADTTTRSVPVVSIIVPTVVDFSKKKISWATKYQTIWNPRAKEIVISDAICWATLTLATNTAPPIQWPIRSPQSRVLDGRFIFSNMADTARNEMQPNMLYQNISIHTSKFLSLVFWRVPCPEMYKSYSVNGNISGTRTNFQ